MGRKISEKLIEKQLAEKFMYSSDWITARINTKEDVSHAIWLFKLNYNLILGRELKTLFAEIMSYSR